MNKVINNDNIVCFDVDDTLVIWNAPADLADQCITFDNFGYPTQLLPHTKHVELIKQFKARGHFVVVWSQGGYQWANEVVKVLGLENYVDLVISKPKWMVDDIPPSAWASVSYIPMPGVKPPQHVKTYGNTSCYAKEELDDEPEHE